MSPAAFSASPDRVEVPVEGVLLRGGRWPARAALPDDHAPTPQVPRVLAIHDLTANHRWWTPLAAALGGRATLLAPDLRGRAGSVGLAGPGGLAQHIADVAAFLDAATLDPATNRAAPDSGPVVVIGHGYGASVAHALAERHAERVAALVLVDPTPWRQEVRAPNGATSPVEAARGPAAGSTAAEAVDPTFVRLGHVYPNRDAYAAWWRSLPSFADGLDRLTRVAVMADLHGSGFAWRVHVNAEVVEHDAREVLEQAGPPRARAADAVPTQSLSPGDVTTDHTQAAPDHLTLVLGRPGAAAIADLALNLLGDARVASTPHSRSSPRSS